jgi:hypothetical protein
VSGGHVIRLHAAWDPPAAAGEPWRRSFGRPGGLTAGDRVWLVLDRPCAGTLELNGERLPAVAAGRRWEADVTLLLRDRNELVATFAGTAAALTGRQPLPEACGRPALEIVPGSEPPRAGRRA